MGLAIFLGLLTAGCGNRGPLYLPNAEETTATAIDDIRETPAGPFDVPTDDSDVETDEPTDEEQDDEKDASAPRGG